MFHTFGDLIQKASELVSGTATDTHNNQKLELPTTLPEQPLEKMETPTHVMVTDENSVDKKKVEEEEKGNSSVHKPFFSTG